MKVDEVRHWYCGDVPEKLRKDGPIEITLEVFETLAKDFDVAVMHHQQMQLRQGAPPVPDHVVLWLDVLGGKFRQR